MRYDWNHRKSELNVIRRGFDFEHATLVFAGPCFMRPDERRDYGEPRFIATGVADNVFLTVVFTDRLDEDGLPVRRIISARRSNRKERRRYEAEATR